MSHPGRADGPPPKEVEAVPRPNRGLAPSAVAEEGTADRLMGLSVPAVTLGSTMGPVDLAQLASDFLVLFVYPHATGLPEAPAPGWDLIPGSRGCTAQACGFRDAYERLHELGTTVAGLSVQTVEDQRTFASRVRLPYALISDPTRRLETAIGLPTFTSGGQTFYRRVTLVATRGRVVRVFSPVLEPERNAAEVAAWLEAREGPSDEDCGWQEPQGA